MTANMPGEFQLREVRVRLEKGNSLFSDMPFSTPSAAVSAMRKVMAKLDREAVCVVNLNNHLQPINYHVVSIGALNVSLAPIPNIFKTGILANAYGILLLHNHPGGSLVPSEADIKLTNKILEAGKLMEIPLMDHVIVAGGSGDYLSLREHNYGDFITNNITTKAAEILEMIDYGAAQGGKKMEQNEPMNNREEITIKFGKGLAEAFTSKDGRELQRILIPNEDPEDKSPWASFVLPTSTVHENQYGKGLWAKIPANGTTIVTKAKQVGEEDGKKIWENERREVPNTELKEMVEAYKFRAPKREDGPER